ncbi:hypothetical protein ACIOKD_14405 [Streptomyces sp. NPDC087844]|uniref:hypothetical protein n=1 Tax=Streptomyces sp. NPDC087844 TaxID=3365805 RepID=UPI0037FF391C
MPWVRLDDRFPSNRKVDLLSDRAFRLYVSALCWSAENLTEGMILDRELPIVARVRGVKKAALELEEARLWDRIDGGWEIHDYQIYQRDREQVLSERAANAARQKAWRDRKRADKEAAAQGASNAPSNGVTDDAENTPDDTSATGTRHDDDTTTREKDAEEPVEPQVTAIRNAVSNGTPSRPNPPSPSEKEKEERKLATRAGSDEPPRIGDRPRIPAASQPLVDALSAAGLIGVGWDLQSAEWFLIEALIQRCGLPALVASATASAQGARSRPRSGRYFLPGWRSLPDAPAPGTDLATAQHGGEVVPLNKSRQQQATDDLFDRAMARAEARMQQES